jgi:hypothetical protein
MKICKFCGSHYTPDYKKRKSAYIEFLLSNPDILNPTSYFLDALTALFKDYENFTMLDALELLKELEKAKKEDKRKRKL